MYLVKNEKGVLPVADQVGLPALGYLLLDGNHVHVVGHIDRIRGDFYISNYDDTEAYSVSDMTWWALLPEQTEES